jgi:hypothetical protein
LVTSSAQETMKEVSATKKSPITMERRLIGLLDKPIYNPFELHLPLLRRT